MEPTELRNRKGYRIGYKIRVLFNEVAWRKVRKPNPYQKTNLWTSKAQRELSEFLKDKIIITLKSEPTN